MSPNTGDTPECGGAGPIEQQAHHFFSCPNSRERTARGLKFGRNTCTGVATSPGLDAGYTGRNLGPGHGRSCRLSRRLAGSLYAHKLSFISPEMFTLLLSIEFVMVIIIGGALGLHGAILGAIFIVMVDPFLTWVKDDVPSLVAGLAATFGAGAEKTRSLQNTLAAVGSAAGLKGAIYGAIIMLFILFEPLGLYGRWLKIKLFFQLFPLYKRATFKRQKIYVKSERNR